MQVVCECGRVEEQNTLSGKRVITQYDKKGRLIFSVCPHNVVLVDKRKISMNKLLAGELFSQEYVIKEVV